MKYDKYGIVIGLNNREHLRNFLEKDDAIDYFNRLIKELPWVEMVWNNLDTSFSGMSFIYGEYEKRFCKYEVLDELKEYVSTIFETTVSHIKCDFFRDKNDYLNIPPKYSQSHTIRLFLGDKRDLIEKVDNKNIVNKYTFSNGDIYYTYIDDKKWSYNISKNKNSQSNLLERSIMITFQIDEPYSERKQHTRHLHILGLGSIPVIFNGPSTQFPENLVGTIILLTDDEEDGILQSFPIQYNETVVGNIVLD